LLKNIEKCVNDSSSTFLNKALKIFNRVKDINIIEIINKFDNPDEIFKMLEKIKFKEINMTSLIFKLTIYAGSNKLDKIGGTKIEVDPKVAVIAATVPIILLIISQIIEFILEQLKKKQMHELELLKVTKDNEREQKIKDAKLEVEIKAIKSNNTKAQLNSAGNVYNNKWFHFCYS
jgi:hypothetical protein